MKRSLIAVLAALALAPVARAEDKPAAKPAEAKPIEKPIEKSDVLYTIGIDVAHSLAPFELSPAELDQVLAGLRDSLAGKARFQMDVDHAKAVTNLMKDREGARSAKYLTKAAAEKGAVKTSSGLIYIPVKEGTGPSPTAADKVKVHYTGHLTDGQVFDSSIARGQPAEFPLGGVIKCWTEGVARMKVGGKARLVCPSDLAYGDAGRSPVIPPKATLDFDVELLDIVK